MKKQTFISCMEDAQGRTIGFERWGYKRLSTVVNKLKYLYNEYHSVYKKDLERSSFITIYPTPDGYTKVEPIARISIDEIVEV